MSLETPQEATFEELNEEAKALVKAFEASIELAQMSDAAATIACIMLIHKLDPEKKHLVPFAFILLQGSEWAGD